jgi:hypothetical protein
MNPIERRTRAAECRRCCTERDIPCRNKTATKQNLDLAINGKMYRGAPIAAVRGSRLWVMSTHSIMPRVLTGHDRTAGNGSEKSFLGRTIYRLN